MARRVMYSFNFAQDAWRASQVRRIGSIEGNRPVTDNEWEEVKRGGDKAIAAWIDGQLDGKSCTIVLIGAATAGRQWINYEIEKTWNTGKGLLGVRIHGLKNQDGYTTTAGPNPFDTFTLKNGTVKLSSVAPLKFPTGADSQSVYASIQANIEAWVEEAIKIRTNYV